MKPQYRQIPAAVLAVLTALSLTACGSGGADSKESTANDSAQSESTPKTPQVAQPENFDTYVSNTVVSTGNNAVIRNAKHVTYRAWIPVEEAGKLDSAT